MILLNVFGYYIKYWEFVFVVVDRVFVIWLNIYNFKLRIEIVIESYELEVNFLIFVDIVFLYVFILYCFKKGVILR